MPDERPVEIGDRELRDEDDQRSDPSPNFRRDPRDPADPSGPEWVSVSSKFLRGLQSVDDKRGSLRTLSGVRPDLGRDVRWPDESLAAAKHSAELGWARSVQGLRA